MRPQSLVWATDIDVLPADKRVFRRDDHLVVQSPSNPGHYWGNLLIFDRAPQPGDRDHWCAAFAAALPGLEHCTLAWDLTDGDLGAAATEFPAPEFEIERTVGLTAAPGGLLPHGRANDEVRVRELAADDPAWAQVLELWMANNAARAEPHPTRAYRAFAQSRLADLRVMFRAGRGGWFVALDGEQVVGSLGVVVTDGRARYQSVDTRLSHRRRGIASRLVYEASRRIADAHPVTAFVIAADPDYHALGIYESLGFARVESVTGVCRWGIRIDP